MMSDLNEAKGYFLLIGIGIFLMLFGMLNGFSDTRGSLEMTLFGGFLFLGGIILLFKEKVI